MNNQISFTDRGENHKFVTFYPLIPNNKSKRNNENSKNKSLKNKTVFNFYNNNTDSQNNNHYKTKSLKVIKPGHKYYKLMNQKLEKFFNKKNINNKKITNYNNTNKNLSIKTYKNNLNNKTFNNNMDININNNTNEMKDILNKLIKLKQKIKELNTIKKKKVNNIKLDKEKYDNYNYSDKTNKYNNFNKIKLNNLNKNEKTNNDMEIKFNNSNKKSEKKNSTINKRKKFILKLSLDKINYANENNKIKELKKEFSKSVDKNKSYNYHNIVTEHTNYIDKIRDSEFINLFKKFKKSMKKNKKEEIHHKKSLVFPADFVNYIIKMKNDLIIDKYRNEYLNKIDTYKYNTQKILRAIRFHNDNNNENYIKNENNSINNSQINLSKSNIKIRLAQKMSDINKNNERNDYIDEKLDLLFNNKDYLEN